MGELEGIWETSDGSEAFNNLLASDEAGFWEVPEGDLGEVLGALLALLGSLRVDWVARKREDDLFDDRVFMIKYVFFPNSSLSKVN
jgi:hypothetical protein